MQQTRANFVKVRRNYYMAGRSGWKWNNLIGFLSGQNPAVRTGWPDQFQKKNFAIIINILLTELVRSGYRWILVSYLFAFLWWNIQTQKSTRPPIRTLRLVNNLYIWKGREGRGGKGKDLPGLLVPMCMPQGQETSSCWCQTPNYYTVFVPWKID
jgi:hypothetical protein